MNIESVRAVNFKSIGNKWVEVKFNETGFDLVRGTNGTGKTTIFHAIVFGLYGVSANPKGIGKATISTTHLINDITKKELLVELELDGYTIRRGLKPNILEVIDKKTGKDIANASSKTIDQKWIEKNILNGVNFAMFMKLTFINNKANSIPFLNMTPTMRKDFLESILSLDIVKVIQDIAKDKASSIKIDLMDAEDVLSRTNYKLATEEDSYKYAVEAYNEVKANVDEGKELAEEAVEECKKRVLKMRTKREKLNKYVDKADEIIDKIDMVDDKIFVLEDKEKKILDMITLKEELIERTVATQEKYSACGTCPTVKVLMGSDVTIEDIEADIVEYGTQLQTVKGNIKKLNANNDKLSKALETLQPYLDKVDELKEDINTEQRLLKVLHTTVEEMNTEVSLAVPTKDAITACRKAVKKAEKTFDEVNTNATRVKEIQALLKDKSLKAEVFNYYVPIIEELINQKLGILFEDDTFNFQIAIDENFAITGFKNQREVEIFKFSDGQLSGIHFAFLLSFQELLAYIGTDTMNILMVDEILDIALDSTRLNKVVDMFQSLSEERMVMVISHNSDIEVERFDRVLQTKLSEMGFTEIEG